MIRLPGYITKDQVNEAIHGVIRKKKLPFVKDIQYYSMNEGLVIQMLHVGPFDQEPVTLGKIQQFIMDKDLKKNGLHHEIYLSDFNKTSPEKMKTILREPVKEG